MALAKKCDVCGKFYEYAAGVKYNGFRYVKINSVDNICDAGRSHDTCPDCLQAIDDFITLLQRRSDPSDTTTK